MVLDCMRQKSLIPLAYPGKVNILKSPFILCVHYYFYIHEDIAYNCFFTTYVTSYCFHIVLHLAFIPVFTCFEEFLHPSTDKAIMLSTQQYSTTYRIILLLMEV